MEIEVTLTFLYDTLSQEDHEEWGHTPVVDLSSAEQAAMDELREHSLYDFAFNAKYKDAGYAFSPTRQTKCLCGICGETSFSNENDDQCINGHEFPVRLKHLFGQHNRPYVEEACGFLNVNIEYLLKSLK